MRDVGCQVCENDGTTTVMVHSRKVDRVVKFVVETDGSIHIITVDENMARADHRCALGTCPFAEALEWLHGAGA